MCEEFLLKWNDYQSSFSSMMESLCLSDEMVDCTISHATYPQVPTLLSSDLLMIW